MNYSDFATGPWTGFYNYQAGGQRHHMDLSLTFVHGIVSGQGNDSFGLFGIAGCYDSETGEIHCTKTYFGAHSVRYRGFADGCTIWGIWEIEGVAKGGFHIWPRFLNVELEAAARVKKAKFPQIKLPPRKIRR